MSALSYEQQKRENFLFRLYGHSVIEKIGNKIQVRNPDDFRISILNSDGITRVTIDELVQAHHEITSFKRSLLYKPMNHLSYICTAFKYKLKRLFRS